MKMDNQEKIRRTLLPHSSHLMNESRYGRIFVRVCGIDMRNRGPGGWSRKPSATESPAVVGVGVEGAKKRKKADEIDSLFSSLDGAGKRKKAKLDLVVEDEAKTEVPAKKERKKKKKKEKVVDKDLKSVLDAIGVAS